MMVVDRENQKALDYTYMLTTATAMVDAVEYYLIEGNIFRIVMVRRAEGFERMTMSLGELLTLLYNLDGQRTLATPAQKARVDAMLATVGHIRQELQEQFYEMIVREIMSRLDSINWFLHDCVKGKEGCRLAFPTEIGNRQRIEELVKALGHEMTDDVAERIARMDERIRQSTRPANFIWPAEVQPLYPQEPYWYLYVLPA